MPKDAKNIIVAVGDDDYELELVAKNAISANVPEEYRQSAVEIVSGEAQNAESQLASIRECAASFGTPPFLDPVKLTWWKGVSFLPGGGRGGKISQDVKSALEKLADSLAKSPLPPNQFLVITAPKLLSTSVFAKKLASIAEVRQCAMPDRSDKRAHAALEKLGSLAKAENLEFSHDDARAFIAKTGPDTRTIVSELAKMRTYLGEDVHKVTSKDIEAITSVGGDETEIWALTDAMAKRNAGMVLDTLKNFQGDNGWPIMIATVAERWFRDLITAKAGGGGNDFRSRKNAMAAEAFTMTELRIARYRMVALREKLVSSQIPDEYVEMELLRCIAKKTR